MAITSKIGLVEVIIKGPKGDPSDFTAEIVNNTDSFEIDKALAANQGRVLDDKIDGLDVRLTAEENKEIIDVTARTEASTAQNTADTNTTNISGLDTRVTALENDNTAVDQVARDAAAAAQSKADTNETDIDALDVRLTTEENKEVVDVTARAAASTAQSTADTANTKANTNETDIDSLDTRVTAIENDSSGVDQVARDAAAAAQSTADTNTSNISALDVRLTAEETKEVIDVTARANASSAQSTADSAQVDATQALTNAASAQSTANTANGKADSNTNRLNDMGVFTGTIISDNVPVEQALQELETDLENVAGGGSVDNVARQGVSDNADAISALDIRLTAEETKEVIDTTARNNAASAQSDATQALSDAASAQSTANTANTKADGNTNRLNDMGVFTGTIISDNVPVESALQQLETAVESSSGGGDSSMFILSSENLAADGSHASLRGDAYIKRSDAPILASKLSPQLDLNINPGGYQGTDRNAPLDRSPALRMGNFYITKGSTTLNSEVFDEAFSTSATANQSYDYLCCDLPNDKYLSISESDGDTFVILTYDALETNIATFISSIQVESNLSFKVSDYFSTTTPFAASRYTIRNNDYIVIRGSSSSDTKALLIMPLNDVLANNSTNFTFIADLNLALGASVGFADYLNTMYIISSNNKLVMLNETRTDLYSLDLNSLAVDHTTLVENPGLYVMPSYDGKGNSHLIHNATNGVKVYDTANLQIVYENDGEWLGYYENVAGNEVKLTTTAGTRFTHETNFDRFVVNGENLDFTTLGISAFGFYRNNSSGELASMSKVAYESQKETELVMQKSVSAGASNEEWQVINLDGIESDYLRVKKEESSDDKTWFVKIE
jgi:hypothetical protein